MVHFLARHCRWATLVLTGALAWPCALFAQRSPNWRFYRASDGLIESYCTAVTVSARGNVWIQHGDADAVSLLDGYQVYAVNAPRPAQARLFETPAGQIWAAASDGLQEFRNGVWHHYAVREIQAEFQTNVFRQIRPFSLIPIEQDRVLCLLSDALIEFNASTRRTTRLLSAPQTGLGHFLEMASARDGGFWISGRKGVLKVEGPLRTLKSGMPFKQFLPDARSAIYDLQRPYDDGAGGLTCVAESEIHPKRVIASLNGGEWKVIIVPGENPRQAWRSEDGVLWGCSISSLFFMDGDVKKTLDRDEALAGQYFDVAREPGGVFWIATSEGLFRHGQLLWQRPPQAPGVTALVHSILQDSNDRLWFADAKGINLFQGDTWTPYLYPDDLEKYFQPSDAMFAMPNGSLIMDGGNRLLRFRYGTKKFDAISHPGQGRLKPLGWVAPGSLAIAVWEPGGPVGAFHLETFDGVRFRVLEVQPEATLGNELNFLFTARNGDWWLGGNNGLTRFHNNRWEAFSPNADGAPEGAFSIAETADGAIWCGTRDRILQFKDKGWSLVRGAFDRVNAMRRMRDGSMWVASNSGLFRFHEGLWLSHGTEEGLPSQGVYEVVEDRNGRIWAGTTRGVSRYNPTADANAPETFIERVRSDRKNFSDGNASFNFVGRDKWKETTAERLFYSHRLDAQEWSPYEEDRSISFSDLAAGKHQFQVRTIDRNWNVDPSPAVFEFNVLLPWYRESRSVFIAGVGLFVTMLFAALAFNRHRQLVRSYAEVEKIVAVRTQQLDKANKELLHSQKMTALGTLAAGVAHDFNNILSIIKGSAQIIESNLDDPHKIRTRVGRIKTVVDQGSEIVRAMLGFGRPSEKQLVTCNINGVVAQTLKLLGDQFVQKREIEFLQGEGLPLIRGSQDFIQQMLLNLIFNAHEALDVKGRIVVSTGRRADLPADLALAPPRAAEYVFVEIRDFGCGIPPDVMPRIFEPFFTTKAFSARRGTGLGLSMVYELARELGYGLMVDSVVGKGSAFTILMPVQQAPGGLNSGTDRP